MVYTNGSAREEEEIDNMIFTAKQRKAIIDDMIITIDTREQVYDHVVDYLDSIHVPHVRNKLDVGDYSFKLPNYPELEADHRFIVELKGSLDELAGNFTKDRDRFAREFERVSEGQKIHLVLEDFTWRKCLAGSYRSKFSPKAYKASLIAWSIKYDFHVWNVTKQDSGEIIYEILKKELEYLIDNA